MTTNTETSPLRTRLMERATQLAILAGARPLSAVERAEVSRLSRVLTAPAH